jgi:nucleotide-binding universal stress UspA family protein
MPTASPAGQVRLVVGVDTSPESIAALDWALRTAAAFGGSVTVVHAVGLLEEGGYRPRPDLTAIVEDACAGVAEPCPPTNVVLEDGPAADVLIRVAERDDADMIVVGRRGLGQAPRVLGSVSEHVLDFARLPVLVVPRVEE